ncbi:MAG TPA: hypothetical protein VLN47_04885 [Clostridiaceae bacterium]|nr:hypothetical protein [Clostridiaceae bacterium]
MKLKVDAIKGKGLRYLSKIYLQSDSKSINSKVHTPKFVLVVPINCTQFVSLYIKFRGMKIAISLFVERGSLYGCP